jgi:hypothetical protein
LAASCRCAHSACQVVWEKDEGVGPPSKNTAQSCSAQKFSGLHFASISTIIYRKPDTRLVIKLVSCPNSRRRLHWAEDDGNDLMGA